MDLLSCDKETLKMETKNKTTTIKEETKELYNKEHEKYIRMLLNAEYSYEDIQKKEKLCNFIYEYYRSL